MKKIISLLLAVMMVIGMLPVSALAEEATPSVEIVMPEDGYYEWTSYSYGSNIPRNALVPTDSENRSFQITANTVPEGAAVTWSITEDSAKGLCTIDENGVLTFTQEVNYRPVKVCATLTDYPEVSATTEYFYLSPDLKVIVEPETTLALPTDNLTTSTTSIYFNAIYEGALAWSISNTDVAAIATDTTHSPNGITLQALTPGTFTVTAEFTPDPDIKFSRDITVTGLAVQRADGEESNIVVIPGGEESTTLQFNAYGSDEITWTSSDESVATVDGNGLVTATKVGSVVITATAADGSFYNYHLQVRDDKPYFEAFNFVTRYGWTGSVTGWTTSTFVPTTLNYEGIALSASALNYIDIANTTLYDADKYYAVAQYTDAEGTEQTIALPSATKTRLENLPLGTFELKVSLIELENEDKVSTYTFSITRPRDTDKNVADKGITLVPVGRELLGELYLEQPEGTMWHADAQGVNLERYRSVTYRQYYYRTYALDSLSSFKLDVQSYSGKGYIRYSTDDGATWTEIGQGSGSTSVISFPDKPEEGNAEVKVRIQILDENTYYNNVAAGKDGWADATANEYTVWVEQIPGIEITGITINMPEVGYYEWTSYSYGSNIPRKALVPINNPDRTFQFTASVEPAEAAPNVIWAITEDSSKGICTIDENGVLTFNGAQKYQPVKVSATAANNPDVVVETEYFYLAPDYEIISEPATELALPTDNLSVSTTTAYFNTYFEGAVAWSLDTTDIARINTDLTNPPNGVEIQALRPGSFTLISTFIPDESVVITRDITVTGLVVQRADGEESNIVVIPGGEESITVQLAAYGSDEITWTTSDESVATVDENGLVTATKVGSVVITATAADGSCYNYHLQVRDDNPYFESFSFVTNYGWTGRVAGWTASTFVPTTLNYEGIQISAYALNYLDIANTTLYDADKYYAVVQYTDAEGTEQTIALPSATKTRLENLPLGDFQIKVTLIQLDNEEKATTYTFSVYRPRDTIKTINSYGLTLIPEGRELLADLYFEKPEGTMWHADAEGVNLFTYSAATPRQLYYRTYALQGLESFRLGVDSTSDLTHVRYSIDDGETWIEIGQGDVQTEVITFPYKPAAANAEVKVRIQLLDDQSYAATGWDESTPTEHTIWVEQVPAANAASIVAAATEVGTWTPGFASDVTDYAIELPYGTQTASLTYRVVPGAYVEGLEPAEDGSYTTELVLGENVITVVSGDGTVTATYKFQVTEAMAPMPFTDVPEDKWYRDEIEFVYYNRLMNGMTDTTFGPDLNASRAMIATVIYRMAGSPEVTGELTFSDCEAGRYYTDAVIWAQSAGIVTGFTDGTFHPDENVTREQLAAMFYRYAAHMGMDVSAEGDLSVFPDADQLHDYSKAPMTWAVGVGLFQGDQNGNLNPVANATRAEIATILMRFVNLG